MTIDQRFVGKKFVGTWKLVRWEAFRDGEPAGFPFGEDALGQVVIGDTGFMGAHLQRADWCNQSPGTDPSLYFFAYSGQCRIEGDRFITNVSMASNPSLVGTEQVRIVSFIGEKMQLEVLPEFDPSGTGRHQRLLWERC